MFRRPVAVVIAAMAALALTAGPALAAPAVPAQGGTGNTCANSVLAQNTTGWSATGGNSTRNVATGHPSAQQAFWVLTLSAAPVITLPPQTVTAGQQRTFAFDAQVSGSVRASVEWFNASNVRLSRVDGPVVTGTPTSWVKATVSGTAPAGATRATVLGTLTAQFGSWSKATNCTYTLTGTGPAPTTTVPPTTTRPPTTTTVPPTTTIAPTTTLPPTTTPLPTTTPATTTAPPTTATPPPPDPGDGIQAAARYRWGNPVGGDEFNGNAVDETKWARYFSPGHAGNGLRRPEQITVNNGILTIAGTPDGTTGGMSMYEGRKYGRWEVRMQVPRGDYRYHPVALLWPDAEDWPVGGEVDYAETTAAATDVDFFLHYGEQNRTTHAAKAVDLTQWHNYAVEWTPNWIKGYVDGVQFFSDTNRTHLPPRSMHQTLQLDWFPNGPTPTTPSQMNVAWLRIYNV